MKYFETHLAFFTRILKTLLAWVSEHNNALVVMQQYMIVTSHAKVKIIPQQAEVAQGVPGRLRPRVFLTFGTTRMVGCQPYAPAAFTPGEIPGTHFQGLSRWGEPQKKIPSDTTGNRSRDLPTSRAVP